MVDATGSFIGLGLSAMAGQLVSEGIEFCLDAIQQRAIDQDTAPRLRLDLRSDLSALREALIERKYKAGTVDKYVACTARFLQDVECAKLDKLRPDDVLKYLNELRKNGLGNGALRLHLCALRTVFDRLLALGITVGIKHVPRPALRRPATREEVCQIMAGCRTTQERFVIDMLNRSKLRPGQLQLLAAPADGGLFGEAVNADCGKAIPCELVPLEVFATGTTSVTRLLPSLRGPDPVSTRTIRRIVERLSQFCGFHTTCTALRKAEEVPWQAVA